MATARPGHQQTTTTTTSLLPSTTSSGSKNNMTLPTTASNGASAGPTLSSLRNPYNAKSHPAAIWWKNSRNNSKVQLVAKAAFGFFVLLGLINFGIFRKLRLNHEMSSCELEYWISKKRSEGTLKNAYYKALFTKHSELSEDFYAKKKVLDIGCGPRGSLEWATESVAVCVDPLAKEYSKLGTTSHSMLYLQAENEDLPLTSHSFDIVASINSLDQVVDVDAALSEVARVIKIGGTFLLYVELHSRASPCQPGSKQRSNAIELTVVDTIQELGFNVDWKRVSELGAPKCTKDGTTASWECPPYDHSDKTSRRAYLALKATRILRIESTDLAGMSGSDLAKHVGKSTGSLVVG